MIDRVSPAYNFGRMPHGWVKSSGNNRRLVEAGRRSRVWADRKSANVLH
jgi:hypothetical protein